MEAHPRRTIADADQRVRLEIHAFMVLPGAGGVRSRARDQTRRIAGGTGSCGRGRGLRARDRGFTASRPARGEPRRSPSDQEDHELRADVSRRPWRGSPSRERAIAAGWRRGAGGLVDRQRQDGHARSGRDAGARSLRGSGYRLQRHDLAAVGRAFAHRLRRARPAPLAAGCRAGVGRREGRAPRSRSTGCPE